MFSRLSLIVISSLLLFSCQKESQVDKATREGILLLSNSSDPKSFDPHIVSGVLESNIMRSLFEGLVQFHPSEDLEAPPGVALEVTPDAEYTVWTAKLRPDAKWSDGEPVTAEDFAFSYERFLKPDLGAKYAEMLYFMKGAEAFNKGETDDFSTVGVKVIDPLTFTITLRGPTPFFKELLKHYTWYPVPKHAVLKHGKIDDMRNPWSKPYRLVGNGPFRIKSFRRNDHIEVERNPHYWDAENVKLNGIRFLPISNVFTEARMFRDGQLHITYTAAPEVVDFMSKSNPSVLRQEPYLGTDFYRFNTTREPLNDSRVRRALSMSLDRESLCKSVFRGSLPAYAITPPMGDYNPPRGVSFEPEKARKLLAEAGFPDGKGFPRLKILIASRETAATLATAIQAMWSKHLGVEVEIENKEWTAYLAATQSLEYDIVGAGWIGDFIDPLTFLEIWSPGNGNNNTGWSNSEFVENLEKSFQATDPEQRYQYLHAAETILMQEAPIAPIGWRGKNFLIHPSVKGWDPLLLDSHPYTSVELIPQEEAR
ncbi:MAG: peptide ABC transporter substrate-binding protein [Akkermansiaceae bacterium]